MTMKEGTYKVVVDPDGNERWYDSNRRLIHEKDTDGNERLYDSNGKLIHVKYSNGDEYWYDPNGNLIHVKYSNGDERWAEYDSNGKLIHENDSDGYEYWAEYDSNGKRITKEEFNGNLIHEITPYDDWPIDAPVIVYDEGESPDYYQIGHWAGVRDGKPATWLNGRTNFTAAEGEYITWDYAKLAEDVK